MSDLKKYSQLFDKYWWLIGVVGVGLVFGYNGLFGERLRVLKCAGRETIAYNTSTGRLWVYDKFKEAYVHKKLTDSKSRTTSRAYWSSSFSEESKIESFFVNGNLKIRKVSKISSSMAGSKSPYLPGGGRSSYTNVDETVVYDAKKDKKIYNVTKNGSSFTCKLHDDIKL